MSEVRDIETESFKIEVYEYLDKLRESGITNMFGAGSFIQDEFGVDQKEASELLSGWMKGFGK